MGYDQQTRLEDMPTPKYCKHGVFMEVFCYECAPDDFKPMSENKEGDFPRVTPPDTQPIVRVFYSLETEKRNGHLLYIAKTYDIHGLGRQLTVFQTADRVEGFCIESFCKQARLLYPNCQIYRIIEMKGF